MAQESFTPSAARYKAKCEQAAAKTRAAGEAIPMVGPFTVICHTDYSAIEVGNRLKELGAKVQGVFGRNLIISIPADQLDAMAATEGVLLIDVSKAATSRTDQTRIVTGTDKVLDGTGANLPQAYTGKGVIVGVIDTGFDFTHPGFKDKDGNLRVKAGYLIGNTNLAGKSEKITVTTTDQAGNTIKDELVDAIITDPKVLLDTTQVKDPNQSHGSHCAFIAAGSTISDINGLQGKPLGGMAPEADIVLGTGQFTEEFEKKVEEKLGEDASSNIIEFYSFIEYMKYLSEKENKPYVVSCSTNSQLGSHNGTSPMAMLLGSYAKNGAPIVVCSSNEGFSNMYIHKNMSAGSSLNMIYLPEDNIAGYYEMDGVKPIKVSLGIYDYKNSKELESGIIEVKYDGKTDVEYGILDTPTTVDLEGSEQVRALLKKYLKKFSIGISIKKGELLKSADSNEKKTVTLMELMIPTAEFIDADGQVYFFTYHISFDEETEIHSWVDNCLIVKADGWDSGVNDMSMGDFNTSGEVFTIGAWVANKNAYDEKGQIKKTTNEPLGSICTFSSYGTDRSGHKYPDVCTPGEALISITSSFDPNNNYDKYTSKNYSNQFIGQKEERKYDYAFASGTSMATPVAAGIVALWMQAANDKGKRLTCADLKTIAKATADTDEHTSKLPNEFGAGKMNAYKGLLYVLDLYTGIPELSKEQPANVTFRVTADKVYADGAENGTPVTLYNLSGVVVAKTTLRDGAVSIADLPAGVYALQLGKLGSTLIRK